MIATLFGIGSNARDEIWDDGLEVLPEAKSQIETTVAW
jgi:hypothetical protein